MSRRVTKDGTLTLNNKRFEAGPSFIGQKVTVRFDPFDLRTVLVISASGDSQVASPVDLSANRHVRRLSPIDQPKSTPPPMRSLEKLADDMAPPEERNADDDSTGERNDDDESAGGALNV